MKGRASLKAETPTCESIILAGGRLSFVDHSSFVAGGVDTDDARFMELPLSETRKTMDEVPTRKRAVYRRRFAMLDEIDRETAEQIERILQ